MAPKVQATAFGLADPSRPGLKMGADDAGTGEKRKAEDEGEASAPKAPKVEDEPELEEDAKEDRRKKIAREVLVETRDATPNVIPAAGGVLMVLSDSGLSYLLSGARANTGVKAGRYYFEARIFEVLSGNDSGGRRGHNAPAPRQQVRVGFSTSSSSLLLCADDDECVCFDGEGFYTAERKRRPGGARFGRDQVVGLLLNLQAGHPNADTISLFKEGKRMTKPMPLPESLKGKTLYPHVSFRNVTMHVNFGPQLMYPLPFKCRMIQDAAQADAVQAPEDKPDKKKYEVVFPICVPDEGTFDWLDNFMQKNSGHMELSDRKIIEWASKSGMGKPTAKDWQNSNDKPSVQFGVHGIDDLSASKVLYNVAPMVPRDYVVMEVRSNLIKSERKEMLAKFRMPYFKKVAKVMVGAPPPAFVAAIHERLLKEKQEKLTSEWNARKAEKERKKVMEKKAKEMAEHRKKVAEDMRKKREEEAAKAAADAEGAEAEAAEEKPEGAEAKDEEMKEEAKEEPTAEVKEEKKEEKPAEAKEEEAADAEPVEEEEPEPKAELTEEEKALKFRPSNVPDLLPATLSSSFGQFSIPTKDGEDFDEIVFEWDAEAKAREYLKSWVTEKKRTTRVEDIQPSDFFWGKLNEWQKLVTEWQTKQKAWKSDPIQREKARKKAEREMKKIAREQRKKLLADQAAAKAAAEAEKKPEDAAEDGAEKEAGAESAADPPGVEQKEAAAAEGEKAEEAAPEEAKAEEGEEAKEEDEDMEEEEEEPKPVDIDAVEDVMNARDGEPLFAHFQFEDWVLLGLRFETNILVKCFKKDVNDPERPGMQEQHLAFYYHKYFRKQLNLRFFGVNTVTELFALVKDTVALDADSVVVSALADDSDDPASSDSLLKLTETARRVRQQKIDAGDETAKLKISPLAAREQGGHSESKGNYPPANKKGGPYGSNWQPGGGGGKWGGGKGFKGYRPPGKSWGKSW